MPQIRTKMGLDATFMLLTVQQPFMFSKLRRGHPETQYWCYKGKAWGGPLHGRLQLEGGPVSRRALPREHKPKATMCPEHQSCWGTPSLHKASV
jgi:hypothetical protein